MNLKDWLDDEADEGFSFDVLEWTEDPTTIADELSEALGKEVLRNYVFDAWLEQRLESLGYDRLAERVRETVLPPPGNTRTGEFGEIVATFLMSRHLGFFFPVLRLRFKDSPSGTQRLIDLVAFKFREPPDKTIIAVAEVKTRTGSAPSLAVRAATQLAGAIEDLPLSLSYIDRRLTEEGKYSMANRVSALLDPQAEHELDAHVFVVTDADTLHDETLSRLEDSDLDKNLTASVVLIGDLKDVISDAFETAGELPGVAG